MALRYGRLGFLLAAGPVLLAQSQATFYAAYEDGLTLQSKGQHASALAAFRRATELHPRPEVRVRTYGTNFLEGYHPWVKIAECALALKDPDTAAVALKQSAGYGIEPGRDRLQQRLESLRASLAPIVATPAPQVMPEVSRTPVAQPMVAAPSTAPITAQGTVIAATVPPKAPAIAILGILPTGKPPVIVPLVQGPVLTPAAPGPQVEAQPTEIRVASPLGASGWSWHGLLAMGAGIALLGTGVGYVFLRRRRSRSAASSSAAADPDATVFASNLPQAEALSIAETQEGIIRLGTYRLRRVLGKGACGVTYLGIRDESNLEVAIKVPHPHFLDDPDFLARFRQEAELGSHLTHPNIVRIIDQGPKEGSPWLAMELVRGTGLDEHLKSKGRLGVREALDIIIQVAEAIHYAHSQGVVHRDLKPSNVMLSDKGAQVLDFGIARKTDGLALTATDVFLGTPMYASPESVTHSRVGPAADRYTLGIILFELLTGKPPFTGPNAFSVLQKHANKEVPSLDEVQPGLPPKLVRLMQRLTHKRPEERPEDGEVIRILREIRSELGA